jgi:hypothetical protein
MKEFEAAQDEFEPDPGEFTNESGNGRCRGNKIILLGA